MFEESLRRLQDNRDFRILFASFLRRRGDAWRHRRTDEFTPLDLWLARRSLTIQGDIGLGLIHGFRSEEAGTISRRAHRALHVGTPLRVYLPFAAFPKRVLLNFSARGADETAVPLLTRLQGSEISGDHLLRVLEGAASVVPDGPTSTPAARAGARIVSAALAMLQPVPLCERLARWNPDWVGLQDRTDILEWVREEGNTFQRGLGNEMYRELFPGDRLITGAGLGRILSAYRDECPDVRTLPGLLLLGIRDVLKVIVNWLSYERRAALLDPNTRILRDIVVGLVLPGIDYFDALVTHLLTAPSDSRVDAHVRNSRTDLRHTILNWTGYLDVTIRVGIPFIFRSEESIVLPREGGPFHVWTQHNYRLALRDAVATHIEVATGDPELELPRWLAHRIRLPGGDTEPTAKYFGNEYRGSRHLAHYYTTRRAEESPHVADEGIRLVIRYRVAKTIVVGYGFLTIALWGVTVWFLSRWWQPALARDPAAPDNPEALLGIGLAIFVLPLSLATIPHRRPLVREKLRAFRWLVYGAFMFLIAGPAATYVYLTVR